LACAPAARAQDERGEDRRPDAEKPLFDIDLLAGRTPRFGEADSLWVSGGLGAADNFRDSVDAYAWTSISWFVAEDVELGLELGLWGHNQPGNDTASLSVSNTIRWHFLNTDGWTLYGDIGFGLLGSIRTVPDGGTGVNFLPRVGVGFTRRLTESSRLQVGLRWHHISNARIGGDLRNPSRDSTMLYMGVIFAF
jgi:hypothetical protein